MTQPLAMKSIDDFIMQNYYGHQKATSYVLEEIQKLGDSEDLLIHLARRLRVEMSDAVRDYWNYIREGSATGKTAANLILWSLLYWDNKNADTCKNRWPTQPTIHKSRSIDVSNALKAYRQHNNLSEQQTADRLRLRLCYYKMVEKGYYIPTLHARGFVEWQTNDTVSALIWNPRTLQMHTQRCSVNAARKLRRWLCENNITIKEFATITHCNAFYLWRLWYGIANPIYAVRVAISKATFESIKPCEWDEFDYHKVTFTNANPKELVPHSRNFKVLRSLASKRLGEWLQTKNIGKKKFAKLSRIITHPPNPYFCRTCDNFAKSI